MQEKKKKKLNEVFQVFHMFNGGKSWTRKILVVQYYCYYY